jgi:hypothetical protein
MERLSYWLDEIESIDADEDDDIDSAWYYIVAALIEKKRPEDALLLVNRFKDADYLNYSLRSLLILLAKTDRPELVEQTMNCDPRIDLIEVMDGLDEESLQKIRATLQSVAMSRLDSVDTGNCYYLSRFVDSFRFNLWEQELIYARARTTEYAKYAQTSIERASQQMTIKEFASAIATLELSWFRHQCEQVLGQRIAQSGVIEGLRLVRQSGEPLERFQRLECLIQVLDH